MTPSAITSSRTTTRSRRAGSTLCMAATKKGTFPSGSMTSRSSIAAAPTVMAVPGSSRNPTARAQAAPLSWRAATNPSILRMPPHHHRSRFAVALTPFGRFHTLPRAPLPGGRPMSKSRFLLFALVLLLVAASLAAQDPAPAPPTPSPAPTEAPPAEPEKEPRQEDPRKEPPKETTPEPAVAPEKAADAADKWDVNAPPGAPRARSPIDTSGRDLDEPRRQPRRQGDRLRPARRPLHAPDRRRRGEGADLRDRLGRCSRASARTASRSRSPATAPAATTSG